MTLFGIIRFLRDLKKSLDTVPFDDVPDAAPLDGAAPTWENESWK